MISPHDIEMEDISNFFFDTVLVISNMRYFKSQELAPLRGDDERDINWALCEDVAIGFTMELRERWLHKDHV